MRAIGGIGASGAASQQDAQMAGAKARSHRTRAGRERAMAELAGSADHRREPRHRARNCARLAATGCDVMLTTRDGEALGEAADLTANEELAGLVPVA